MTHQPTEKETRLTKHQNKLYRDYLEVLHELTGDTTMTASRFAEESASRKKKPVSADIADALVNDLARSLFDTTTKTLEKYPHAALDPAFRADYDAFTKGGY